MVREQLSGSCTTEIAAFDEFVDLLGEDAKGYDHVVFDAARTGHTLRLLSLPKAWTGFLEGSSNVGFRRTPAVESEERDAIDPGCVKTSSRL